MAGVRRTRPAKPAGRKSPPARNRKGPDSFRANNADDPNRGRRGYRQFEDGSWGKVRPRPSPRAPRKV